MTTRFERYARFYGGDVLQKLAEARGLHVSYGADLRRHPGIMAQLEAVLAGERLLGARMADMEMGATCSQCAARPGGGCCSRFMAGENDVLQLLMNMLAGVEVEPQEKDQASCCFLGGRGCQLTLKPLFCLNYNCCHIKDRAEAATLHRLDQCAGDLLRSQVALEQLLLDYFAQHL